MLTIGELVGVVKLDTDEYDRKEGRVKRGLEEIGAKFDGAGARSNAAALSFLNAANSISNIPTALQAIAGAGTIMANLSGAVGLIPAAGAGAVAAIAAIKLGTQGFSDAIKETDPAKFAEDLKSLAPAAQESAKAVHDLSGSWKGMQQSVQQSLFAGLGEQIKQLGHNYLPTMKDGLSGIAAGLNVGAQQTAAYLNRSTQVKTVAGIFGNIKSATDQVGGSMSALVQILLDVVSVGSDFLPGLTGGFTAAAERAADFVNNARETGKLKEWISKGLSTIGDLFTVFKQLGQIVITVFKGLGTGGQDFLGKLIKLTAGVRDFLQSVQGQAALHALGQAMSAVSTVVTQVMLTALRELAPIIVDLAPGFAKLAQQVGTVLVAALKIAGPLLDMLARFLSDNVDWLGPLAIGLYAGIQAFNGINAVLKLLKIEALSNPWLAIIAATVTLAILIVTHWDNIKAALSAAWEWIKNTARTAWEHIHSAIIDPITKAASWVNDRIGDIKSYFDGIPDKIESALTTVYNVITSPFKKAIEFVTGLFTGLFSLIEKTLNAISSAFGGGGIGNLSGGLAGKVSQVTGVGSVAGGGLKFRANGG
ncbi:MAG: hypothetical protein QOD39_2875, partial [Mycobacterium sp.]|nr:hypothetical protein [Mycobacterium sp.]